MSSLEFIDTMNMASRMESTGMPGRVQISSDTAALLQDAGKDRWISARESDVFVKGKGDLKTFWLNAKGASPGSMVGSQISSADRSSTAGDAYYELSSDKTARLIEWNVDILQRILKQIVARRNLTMTKGKGKQKRKDQEETIKSDSGMTVIDEVREIIELPKFDVTMSRLQEETELVELPPSVMSQLRSYVACIVDHYQANVSRDEKDMFSAHFVRIVAECQT